MEKTKKTIEKLPLANVICIKWGKRYSSEDVNLLYVAVKRNTKKHTIKFFCFTEDSKGLHKDIIVKPLPGLNIDPKKHPEAYKELNRRNYAYQKEAGLCDDNLGGLKGQRVLFFDIDMVITGTIDCFMDYPKNDDFVIIKDWNTKGNHVGQASCYSWKVGTLGYVKKYFEDNPMEMIKKFYTASQEYLSYKVIEKFGRLNFWPKEWVKSFKFHCLPVWFLRPFVMPKLPKGTKLLAFHGQPKMEDAIIGRWSKHVPFLKRIYKTIKPSPWIRKYLRK
ncbi:MAG: hypothetical protein JXR30_02910 [Alphaproteobacteria bacterium]|nr:hypothetical protein [Alphaproteobacteria bacterium]